MLGMLLGLILLIAVGFMFTLGSAIFVQAFGEVTTTLINIDTPGPGNLNISDSSEKTFGQTNLAFQQLRWWSFMIMFGMIAGIIISALLVRVHPSFFGLYILLTMVLTVFSIFISRGYEDILLGSNALSGTLQSFVGASFMLQNLPVIVVATSMIGAVLAFV